MTDVSLVERAKDGRERCASEGSPAWKSKGQIDPKDPQQTQVCKSIFRVTSTTTHRVIARSAILSNVFLHLHPAKINRDAVRYSTPGGWAASRFIFSSC